MSTASIERFWTKVEKTDSCWLWTGGKTNCGYGVFTIGSKTEGERRNVYAHRWAYESIIGPIPEGLCLDHLCRNRGCVNPGHLEPVTHKENSVRGVGFCGKNAQKTRCNRGHAFSKENTCYSKGQRRCRACNRENNRKYRMGVK